MDALMLDGWTPILLVGIVIAIIIFFISHKISRKALFLTSTVLSLICVGIVIYSIMDILASSILGIIMWWLKDGIHFSSEYIANQINELYR